MLRRCRGLLVAAVLVGWLGLAGPAAAVYPPPVKDDAKLFSAEALEKANKKVRDIYANYKKDVVIETYTAVPEGKTVPEDPNKRGAFFTEWAQSRAKELGINGVYVLICKSPTILRIRVDPDTTKKAFTNKDVSALAKKLIEYLKEKKFDNALAAGLEVIETAYKANLK
jgi:hypothetical protein